MKRYLLILPVLMMLFVACSHDDDGGVPSGENLETVKLYISVPGVQSTRMGDPGTAVPEGEDWDRLAIMVEYTGTSTKRLLKTISKTDFDNLPSYDQDGKIKIISLDVEKGDVYIYGVTYTSTDLQSPESVIEDWVNNSGVAVSDLTISNAYAGGVMSKFVSVATGFYDLDDLGNHTGERKIYSIKSITDPDFSNTIPTIILTRLAAKIDIQWDAADAYEAGYTDVKVTGFTYDSGNANVVGVGFGRLFPDLVSASASASAIGGSKEFYNTSEISQRNGRVYHYVFPDGVSKPSVIFNISATQNETTTTDKLYTMTFKDALQKATWYKVNATIRGITGSGNITLSMDNTGVQTGE